MRRCDDEQREFLGACAEADAAQDVVDPIEADGGQAVDGIGRQGGRSADAGGGGKELATADLILPGEDIAAPIGGDVGGIVRLQMQDLPMRRHGKSGRAEGDHDGAGEKAPSRGPGVSKHSLFHSFRAIMNLRDNKVLCGMRTAARR